MARAYTVASLAQEWGCSEGVIRKLVRDGKLRCFRPGNLIRIPAEEVRRFECQNIPSNDCEAATPSSIETWPERDIENDYTPKTVLGLKRRHGAGGTPASTVHRGPWAD